MRTIYKLGDGLYKLDDSLYKLGKFITPQLLEQESEGKSLHLAVRK